MADPMKEVVLRLERLEEKINTIAQKPNPPELSAADIEAYHKVQNAFWEDGSCGINETSPCIFKCNIINNGKVIPIPIPQKCDFECICGPCNICNINFGSQLGGGLRFRGLGR